MYQFQIPLSWPLPPDFIPLYGWEPPWTFTIVSNDWEFWLLKDYDATLPLEVPEDRGNFNRHPFEIAARQVEMNFIRSKAALNEAIKTAYIDRKQKEQFDRYARYAQTRYEMHVEELIRELVYLGGDVRKARTKADQEFQKWRQPSPTNNSSQSTAHLEEFKAVRLPSNPVKKAPDRIKLHTNPNPSQKVSHSPSLPPPPVPTYQKVLKYVGPSRADTANQKYEDILPHDVLWNTLIQKVHQLNSTTLSADKEELITALEKVKLANGNYENLVISFAEDKGEQISPPARDIMEEKLVYRKDTSTSHRSQYIQREVEGYREKEDKIRFRKEAKIQKEKEDERQAGILKEHISKVSLEADRLAALKYEETHLLTALSKVTQIRTHNRNEKAEFMIADLKAQLEDVRQAMKSGNVIANDRAGWVYVISNVGSFGEGIVKIGVTRNHDPYSRIRELNSASVPFTFDVHVLHFSTDALGLEAALHRHFSLNKVNLINEKKEFFYTTPEEVKTAMQILSDGALTEFKIEAPAAEWYKSEEIRECRKYKDS
jgi:hypothetical protein